MKLVAIKMGFHGGVLVHPGETVVLPEGHKVPKWLKPAQEAAAVIAADEAKAKSGDTKPDAVQAAVKRKAAGAAGD